MVKVKQQATDSFGLVISNSVSLKTCFGSVIPQRGKKPNQTWLSSTTFSSSQYEEHYIRDFVHLYQMDEELGGDIEVVIE